MKDNEKECSSRRFPEPCMLPPMVFCWERLESGARVDGQWLGHDGEMGPMRGMCGTLDADLRCSVRSKELSQRPFLCLLRKAIGPTMMHVDNKGNMDRLWRGDLIWEE